MHNAPTKDIAYAYNYEPWVVFDFTRDKELIVNYSVIEHLKNGVIFSWKYESFTKRFPSPKIICLSNFTPEFDKLSKDRWLYYELFDCDVAKGTVLKRLKVYYTIYALCYFISFRHKAPIANNRAFALYHA